MQLQQQQNELEKLKIQPVAISIEKASPTQSPLSFPVLMDPEHTIIDAFQVYSPQDKYALPALFLIDSKGTIQVGRVGVAHGPFDDQALPDAIQWVKDHGKAAR